MRIGDVEPHPAGAAGADLHVRPGAGPPQRLDHDLHVANELRHGERQQVLLDVGSGDGAGVRRVEEVAGALELVLVGERGGGVDAVHDGVRAVAIEDLEHEAALQHVVRQIAEHVFDHQAAVRRFGQEGRAIEPGDRGREKDVPPLDVDRRAPAVGRQRVCRGPHLVLEQRYQHEALRASGDQPASHRLADQPAPAEDYNRSITQVHAVARSRGSRVG